MRIAFLTVHYPSEQPTYSGIATYVRRMAQALVEQGHEPEVFVSTPSRRALLTHRALALDGDEEPLLDRSRIVCDKGIMVHEVNWTERYPRLVSFHRQAGRALRSNIWHSSVPWLLQARALAVAMEQRHELAPFALIQSTDYECSGFFVRRRLGRVHVVRCSQSADLYYGEARSRTEALQGYLERRVMRSADVVYAPSKYLAEHFHGKYHIDVKVIRPPKYLEQTPTSAIPLPERFLFHFGDLGERKGTDWLARALPLAWAEAPDLTMVWSGHFFLDSWRALWGQRAEQVHVTGPLPPAQTYAVLQRADATVLPSLVDNLPNSVIESLMLGVPVIGTRGVSIDELVEEGKTGHLVEIGDVQGLADALVRMWFRQTPTRKGFSWDSEIAKEMSPVRAVENLVSLYGKQPK
jgi:glycosyltransferase involved in cell wall biosynthesis